MNPEDFRQGAPGRLVKTLDGAWAFVPAPLPPKIDLSLELMTAVGEARGALGELAGVGRSLPNPHLLIQPFSRKEAEASSRIEGTETDLGELFVHEVDPARRPERADIRREVLNYVRALEAGLSSDLPVSLRLVKEMHSVLMEGVRGQNKAPGDFRRVQNRIGGTSNLDAKYVPPPVPEMESCISDWEKFLHAESSLSPLMRLAMIHYQFEAIHPFVDGNGRIGRLLLPLLLCRWQILPLPLLYLSAYFERHRSQYYDLLSAVSQRGEWPGWLKFFLHAVEVQAKDAARRAKKLMDKKEEYRQRAQIKGSTTALRLVDELIAQPACHTKKAMEKLDITMPTALRAIDTLERAGILREITGRQKNRVWVATEILEILQAEDSP
ncbi:MAG: Fic family protein [Candidatus Tectomicrobia bacterium]|uniref:Fic family protein n=1 Tax=Tectimicrobiota bacterium TaxID=2528274 RepID=A0A932MNN0_UNCTE|nr:Fic family protein [Candidatus Tectomicrobia bacterium]